MAMNENLAVGANLPTPAAAKRQEPLADNKDGKASADSVVSRSLKSTACSVNNSGTCAVASTSAEADIDCIGSAVKHLILESNSDSDDIGNRVKIGGKHVFIRIDRDCWHPLRSMLSKTRTKAQPSKSKDKSREEPVVIFAGQIHANISSSLCTKKGIPHQVWEKIIKRLYAVSVLQPTHMRVAEPLEKSELNKQESRNKDEYPTSSTTFNVRTSQLKAIDSLDEARFILSQCHSYDAVVLVKYTGKDGKVSFLGQHVGSEGYATIDVHQVADPASCTEIVSKLPSRVTPAFHVDAEYCVFPDTTVSVRAEDSMSSFTPTAKVSVRWQTADISKPTSQPPATAMAKVQVRPLGLNSGDDLSRRLSCLQKFFEAFSRGEWLPLRADLTQKWTWEEHFEALVNGAGGSAATISWSDSMDFTEKLCESLGCMQMRTDALQLLRHVIQHFKEGKLLPFIHKDNDTTLGVHLREAVAIARRKRYGTGSGTAQHEEQLQRWIRTSDAWVDLSNHKQPAQLVLDVSLWQLRRQFGRLPCFSNESEIKNVPERSFEDEFAQLAALNNVRQLMELCERTLGLNAVDARRVYRKARQWYGDHDVSDLRYFDVVLHNHIPQTTRNLLTLQSWRQMTIEAAPDVSLQIFHSFLPECRLIDAPRTAADSCFKVSPMALSRLKRVLHKSGCSRMMVTSLIGYLQDDEDDLDSSVSLEEAQAYMCELRRVKLT